ncbi:MAG: DUF1289 domain-containing protein [Pseudomonadota bacterium]
MSKLPSPCIDVCKFRRAGHCIGCSMTKDQKSIFKKLKKESQKSAFLTMLTAQQAQMGKYRAWPDAYARKCAKKGVEPRLNLSGEV